MLDNYSIDMVSIEIYENHIFSSDITPIRVYMFELSFLTILNIYKDYFKAVTVYASECNLMQKFFTSTF